MDRLRSLLERRSLVARLVAGCAALLLTILLIGIYSVLLSRDMSRQAAELYRMDLLGISHIKEANIALVSTGRALRQMVLAPTFVDRDQARAQLGQAMHDLEQEIGAARQSIFRSQEKPLLHEFELAFEHYKRNVDGAIALIDRRFDYQKKATAYISGEQFNQVGDSADQLLHRMVDIKEEGARETAVAMARYSRYTQWLTLALLLGGLSSGTAVAVLIVRSLKQPAEKERQAEFIQTEAYEIVENMPDGMFALDAQSAIIPPGHGAKIFDEDCNEESFEPLDGSHIAPIRRSSILVVEDDESNQAVGLPASAACKITVVHSGQEALELLEKSPYDVVLLNMHMMMDGIDATLQIRENPAFEKLPIIAVTASGIHQDIARCLAAGMDGHIAKPINPDELFRAFAH